MPRTGAGTEGADCLRAERWLADGGHASCRNRSRSGASGRVHGLVCTAAPHRVSPDWHRVGGAAGGNPVLLGRDAYLRETARDVAAERGGREETAGAQDVGVAAHGPLACGAALRRLPAGGPGRPAARTHVVRPFGRCRHGGGHSARGRQACGAGAKGPSSRSRSAR